MIKVCSGSLSNSKYSIFGNVLGSSEGGNKLEKVNIKFSKDVMFQSPSRIGGVFLTNLNSTESGHFVPNHSFLSIIEVSSVFSGRPDIALVLEKLGLAKGFYFKKQSYYWYPVACENNNNDLVCKEALSILKAGLESIDDVVIEKSCKAE